PKISNETLRGYPEHPFVWGDELMDGHFITTLYKRGAETVWPLPPLLLCDFESDIEFYRHPKGKAGNADYQPNRCFLNAKDISKQVRNSVRDPGLVEEIPRGCHEYSDPDDASHSIE